MFLPSVRPGICPDSFVSRDQLRQNVLIKQYYCDVDIAHLISYNQKLAHKLTTEPADIIPLVNFPIDFCKPSGARGRTGH